MDEQKKIQSQWSITQDSLKPAKSELEIKEIESDLKKTGDWEIYYQRMYEKTGNQKYKDKLNHFKVFLKKLKKEKEEGKKGIRNDAFEKAFMDAVEKRILKDMKEDMENNIRSQ